jgi:hypothetical protein
MKVRVTISYTVDVDDSISKEELEDSIPLLEASTSSRVRFVRDKANVKLEGVEKITR